MNQRARHAFASFTRSDDREDETVVGMRARDERSDRGLRDRKTDARKERERENAYWGRVKWRETIASDRDCGVRFGLY